MKKAISPIVATVLLVSFVIAMGVIIGTWMRTTVSGYVEEEGENIGAQISCLNVKMQLEKVEGEDKVYIKNNGETEISGYTAVKYDGDNVEVDQEQKNSPIEPYNAIIYPGSLSGDKVKIIPWVSTKEGNSIECTEQEIILQLT
ncbi:unnamed protein product [marine sediment metagenome]|uniref:Archaeal Type IV pilin N-terminal domain-containing protein n=1 Tax=marine sediment metagenome TaxID=412755 RepID=X0SN00_9ZZZZ